MPAARRGIFIGIDSYQDPAIPDLKGARNDAREMRDRLTDYGNFQVDEKHVLLNDEASAGRIRGAISDLLWKTEESDVSLLYFSGHGLTDPYGNGFIAPYDMIKDQPLAYGVRMQELRELMLSAKNKKTVLIILDCCYSGIAAEGEKAVAGSAESTIDDCLMPMNELANTGEGRIVLTSSSTTERSREIEMRHRLGGSEAHPHGAFTFEVLEGLDGRASAGGRVTLGSLFHYVEDNFRSNPNHRPKLYGSGVSSIDDIFLCRAGQQEALEQRLGEVRELLSRQDDLAALFYAIRKLSAIFADSPGLEEALDIRATIDAQLRMLRVPASAILFEKMVELSMDCNPTYTTLESAVMRDDISFESISQEDEGMQNLILCLFEVSVNKREPKILQRYLIDYHNRPRTLKIVKPADAS